MANRQLYRKAAGKVRLPVDSAEVVEVGDAIYLATDDARPASSLTYVSGNLAATQANFAAKFIGVAAEASESGDTDDITIGQGGIYEFDCAAAQFEVGDLVGMDDNAGPTALMDQQVIAIGENGYGAIGRVAKRYSANTTRVQVEIFQPSLSPSPLYIPVFQGLIDDAEDLLTAWPVQFPFKLVAVIATVTIAIAGGDVVLTVDKNSTALDDTVTVPNSSAIGYVKRQAIDDATGDDIFIVGDTLSIANAGAASGGECLLVLEVRPFLLEA
jgi:hypothetical protein